ncbi:MAG: peptidase T [Daejeonella sp.]|uniref:peptidase T n=1 Tax=Daejeonella sp. TaxID=2805397 RepID=UPI0027331621|nr:peptidase T [Daejeonella sp.]MDP3466993.1 peptidase T [Daejeonella sp.]
MTLSENIRYTVTDRFLRYTAIDTQSNPASASFPSTAKQKNLGSLLVSELIEMGLKDAHLDEYGYVYASIPGNTDKKVPGICFCSHMDTSPDCSGENVKAIIHKNYQGQDIILPDDPNQILRMKDHPDLKDQIGNDIITASGLTLLGADNKAGIAEIMDAANFLISHPEYKHGEIKILFTPDEEIGRGVDKANLKKLGADFAYTIDGETAGSIENETFSADGVKVIIQGLSAHPGFAKNNMESALKIASEVVSALPKEYLSPESTSGREGFIHPVSINGSVEQASIEFIIRDFNTELLKSHELVLEQIVKKILLDYPGSGYEFSVEEQYRNMKSVLDQYPQVVQAGIEAIERSGLTARLQSIRGGTDGSRLSFMGLPCPNIFAGEHAFHGKQEWVSIQDMQKAVQTIINLALIWEEKS